jgi:hypothetical protein
MNQNFMSLYLSRKIKYIIRGISREGLKWSSFLSRFFWDKKRGKGKPDPEFFTKGHAQKKKILIKKTLKPLPILLWEIKLIS